MPKFIQRGAQRARIGGFRGHARADDDIERRQILLMHAKTLPYQTTHPITVDRAPQISCRNGHAQTSPGQPVGLGVGGEYSLP